MRSKLFYPSKKYLWTIILWTSAAVLLVTIVLSFTVYLNSQRILLQKEYESNKKVFDQVKINIDMMDTMASNLCKSIYSNNDVSAIMYSHKEDVIDETTRINRVISTSISANPYIHSVTIYNNYLHRFYNAGNSLFYDDKQLISMLNREKKVPKLKAVSRNIEKLVNGQKINEKVFSYFMYSYMDNTGELEGAIALNVNTDWFLENIKQINMIEKDRGDKVFVLDSNNEYIDVAQKNDKMEEGHKKEFIKHIDKAPPNENIDFFKYKYDGVNYLLTYSRISSMNITIIKVQKLSEVYKSIDNLRTSVIIITLIFLVVAFIISSGISRKIYMPVGKLVQLISSDKRQNIGNSACSDEISYLSDFCKTIMEKLDVYDKERYINKDITKQYWLNRLLEESYTINTQNVKSIFDEGKISLSSEEKFVVCVFKIDNYKAFMNEYSSKDRELWRFALINISSEVIGKRYKNEGIDMKDDQIALIIGVPEEDASYLTTIEELIKETQKYIMEYFKLSFSASVSQRSDNVRDITSLYNKTINNAAYRLKLGHSCIITAETIHENEHNRDNGRIKELEALLVDKLKSSDFNQTEAIMKKIFNEISLLEYDYILISLIDTASVIKNTLDNLKITVGKYMYFDFGYIYRCIMEKETLEDIYDVMTDRIRDIFDNENSQPTQSKDSYIVDAVKEFIQKNYQDSDLSLTKIADVLNISTRRLSKVFKDETKISVSDYINNARLDKAADLLTTTSLNVNEVISRLGIENETYFYGMFKKKFGLTPKEYAFKRIVKMTQE